MEVSEAAPISVETENHKQYCIIGRMAELGPPLKYA